MLVVIGCEVPLLRRWAPHATVLLVNESTVSGTVPALPSRFLFQLRFEIIETLRREPNDVLSDWLWLESITTLVHSALPLRALR